MDGPDGSDNDWGPWCHGYTMDVVAPGVNVWTTSTAGVDSVSRVSVTSVGSPMVAGLASMMLAERLDLYPYDVLNLIRLGATDVVVEGQDDLTGFDIHTGYGRVDAARTLGLLRSPLYLLHATHTGGSVDSSATTDLFRARVAGWEGGEPGAVYWVRRQTVRAPQDWATGGMIAFPTAGAFDGFYNVPTAWGRGLDSLGVTTGVGIEEVYGSLIPYVYTAPFCDPVPGSVTQTGLQLFTYRYEVFVDEEGTDPLGAIPDGLAVSAWVFRHSAIGDTVDVVGVPDVAGRPWSVTIEGRQPTRGPVSIAADLPQGARVVVDVHDAAGRRIASVLDGRLPAGRHLINWDGKSSNGFRVAPGVYFVSAHSQGYVVVPTEDIVKRAKTSGTVAM